MQKIEEDEKEALTDKREDTAKKKKHKKKQKNKYKRKKEEDMDEPLEEKKKSSTHSEPFIIGTYNLIKMLGSGSFGEIHLAYDTSTRQLKAIKFELAAQKNPQLKHEFNILEQLGKNEGGIPPEGIPRVYSFDRVENKCNYMIMDFLGPSLADLFQLRNKAFSLQTVCLVGVQMLHRIEYIHEKGFLHRDIKPENFTVGLNEKSSTVFLIDFGLAKRYKDKNSGQHIPYRENRHLIGTARYASINAHLGIEQSRRDDIESIGYVLVYLLNGRLPWQSKNDKAKSPAKIMEKKLVTPPEILCKKQMGLAYYFHYCRNLKFEDRPDYSALKSLLFDLAVGKESLTGEFMLDWFIDDEEEKKQAEEEEGEGEGNINNNNNNVYNNTYNISNAYNKGMLDYTPGREDLIDLEQKDQVTGGTNYLNADDILITTQSNIQNNLINLPTPGTNNNSDRAKETLSFDRDLFLSSHVRNPTVRSDVDFKKKTKDSKESKESHVESQKESPGIDGNFRKTHKENDNWSEKSSARDTEREVYKKDNEHIKTLMQGSDSNKNSDSAYKLLDSSEKSSEEKRKLINIEDPSNAEIVLKPKNRDTLLDIEKRK